MDIMRIDMDNSLICKEPAIVFLRPARNIFVSAVNLAYEHLCARS